MNEFLDALLWMLYLAGIGAWSFLLAWYTVRFEAKPVMYLASGWCGLLVYLFTR
jgi:hypothetical protein